MISKLRVLVAAAALVAAGTGTAAAKPVVDDCQGSVAQADITHAVVAVAEAASAEQSATALRCATAKDDTDPIVCATIKNWVRTVALAGVMIIVGSDGDLIIKVGNNEPQTMYNCPPSDWPPHV